MSLLHHVGVRGTGGETSHILNLGNNYRLLSSFTHRPLGTLGKRRFPQDTEGSVDSLAANRRPLSVTGNGTPAVQSAL